MGITEVTVPKQYVIVQATEPTGAFDGQLWYDNTNDLTYIFQDGDWKLITLDVSQEVLDLATENAQQQIDIIELQANASVTPFDHDTLISDTFSDADGFKDSVNTGNTTAKFDTNKYVRKNNSLLSNLVSWWEFEETSGNAIDPVSGNTGTATSINYSETGIINNCFDFNGSTSKVDMGAISEISGNWTIAFWGKTDSTEISADLINLKVNSGSDNLRLFFWGQSRSHGLTAFVPGGSHISLDSEDTNWHFIVLGYDGSKVYLYRDNVLVGSSTPGVSVSDWSQFIVGADISGIATLDGKIDELAVWNRFLSSSERTELWNSGNGVGLYSLTDETETVEIDLPTITGTVTHTELIANYTTETGASITYKINNGTTDDTEEEINTKNVYNLTGAPTKLKILLNPKDTEPSAKLPSIKSYCLKLWKN
jgi:hypothetical protein